MRLVMIALLFASGVALNNGLGRVPPMGFNPWNVFGITSKGTCKLPYPWACPEGGAPPECCHGFNESVILDVAKAIASSPLKAAGYQYINLDCGYSTGFRDANSNLQVDTKRYPHGMKWLGDRIHELGLKFGIYSDAGMAQCCSRVHPGANDGSLHHEDKDAALFASWGVDYLKHDDCGAEASSYPAMRDALNKTGRPIYYSIHGPSGAAAVELANCWRTTGDINAKWAMIMDRAHQNNMVAAVAAPGAFNDPDMLEVGNYLTAGENRAHFSLWCLMKAPLLIGTDVTNMTGNTLEVLTNGEVIAVNQDPLGIQGTMINTTAAGGEVWVGGLSKSRVAVVLLNPTPGPITMALEYTMLAHHAPSYIARDLWRHESVGTLSPTAPLSFHVPARDVVMLRMEPAS